VFRIRALYANWNCEQWFDDNLEALWHMNSPSYTYDHRTLRTRLPVRSALVKQRTGGSVVRRVTTSAYPLLYFFCCCFRYLRYRQETGEAFSNLCVYFVICSFFMRCFHSRLCQISQDLKHGEIQSHLLPHSLPCSPRDVGYQNLLPKGE
jgi:hypothetical protein